jgi:two-component system OmpR family response regulator
LERPRRARRAFEGDAVTGTRSRLRVLIVDDDPDARELYGWGMRAAGWAVAYAKDGAEALDVAESFRPDAIIMDLRLPILGGLDAIRRLRSDEQSAGVAIVALSGTGRVTAEAEAREAGCDVFVPKPFPPEELCGILELILARHGSV